MESKQTQDTRGYYLHRLDSTGNATLCGRDANDARIGYGPAPLVSCRMCLETMEKQKTPFHPDTDAVDPYGRL